jgi:hypothetical protein
MRRFTFRPRGFAPPRRFPPRGGHGSVAPRNRSRVRRVSCLPPSHAARRWRAGRGQSPRRGSNPSKSFPRQQPYRITAALAFLPLPSCPAWAPTEAADRADRRPPRRVAYSRGFPAPGLRWPSPEGQGGRFPVRRATPEPRRVGRGLRRGPVRPSRWGRARGAPRSAVRRVPRTRGAVPVGQARGAPKRAGCRVPVDEARGAPKRAGCRVRWTRRAVRRSAPVAGSGEAGGAWGSGRGLRGGPPIPVERGARRPEGCRLPSPGGAVRPVARRPPVAVPRWSRAPGGPKTAGCRAPVEPAERSAEARRHSDPGWPGAMPRWAGTGVRGRGSDAMMLRSAEADPHVIEHRARRGPKRPGLPREIAPSTPTPKRWRCCGQSSPRGSGMPPSVAPRPGETPEGDRRGPSAEAERNRSAASAPTEVGRRPARRNLTEQPTSRRCSADESVVTIRRCQRSVTRSFHGLCGPLQGPARSAPARRCLTRRCPRVEPKPGVRVPRPSTVAANRRGVGPLGSLRRFTLHASRRGGGATGGEGGRSRIPLRRLFSAGVGAPCRAPSHSRGRSRARRSRQCFRSLSGTGGRDARVHDAARGPSNARRRSRSLGEPRGARHRPS